MHLKSLMSKYWGELVYVFSNTYTLIITMVTSVVATAFIVPADLGVIQTVLLFQVYFGFFHLGVFNGLNRNLAFYKAQGNFSLVQDMVNTTYTVSYVVAILGALFSIGLFLYYLIIGKGIVYLLSALLLLILQILQPLTNAVETTYRSGQEFKRLGVIKNIESTLYAAFTIFPIILGYIGKIIADSLKSIIGYILRYTKRPYPRTGFGSKKSLELLIKTGAPMLVSGYLWTVFAACDRTYIASHFGMEEMGLYVISGYVITAVMAVPTAVNTLLYPKAAARYGKNGDVRELKNFWGKSLLLYVAMLIPLCAILFFLLPPLVETFLPKYVGGIKASQYSLLTCMTFVYRGPSVLFGTLRRNTIYIILLAFSIVAFWGAAMVFNNKITTIESVSLLRFYISLVQMIIIVIVTYIYVK